MNQISLTTVPVETLESTLRQIIRSELNYFKQADQHERMLSPSEVCNQFSPAISKTTLSKWTKMGLLTAYRIGGRVYYRSGELNIAMKELKRYKRY